MTEPRPNLILIKPSKSWFGGRRQWKFELHDANGKRIDPRDTYANRDEAASGIVDFFISPDPLKLVIYDRYGNVEERITLR